MTEENEDAGIGHNSEGVEEEQTTDAEGVAADRLKSFIERVERLEEEKASITHDVREVYSEAKAAGFDTKIMRQVVKLRKMDSQDREEQRTLLDMYLGALGI